MKPPKINIESFRDALEVSGLATIFMFSLLGVNTHIQMEKHTMTQMILKLKEDERVCIFCDIVQATFLATFPIALPFLIMAASMKYQDMKYKEATASQVKEWHETDYWMKMDYNPLVMFVVIPTIIQVMALGLMFGVMAINDWILQSRT